MCGLGSAGFWGASLSLWDQAVVPGVVAAPTLPKRRLGLPRAPAFQGECEGWGGTRGGGREGEQGRNKERKELGRPTKGLIYQTRNLAFDRHKWHIFESPPLKQSASRCLGSGASTVTRAIIKERHMVPAVPNLSIK